jgi:ATP-dependent Clp protease ATP-binding subunit ClpA
MRSVSTSDLREACASWNARFEEALDTAARRALAFACSEAVKRKAHGISPEYILLGIVHEQKERPSPAWPSRAARAADLEATLEERCRPFVPSAKARAITWTAESTRVLEAANRHRVRLGHPAIGLGHLLLGLLTHRSRSWGFMGAEFCVKRYLIDAGFDRRELEAALLPISAER